ncbi:MAG: DUF881 domain-containing protein [Clostridia bacterium]|nr:DUF881 domain-containing protein [Clostridia bacterium]
MKKANETIWMFTLVCVILGFFAAQVFDKPQAMEEIGGVTSLQNIENLLNQKKTLDSKRQELEQLIAQQERKIKEYENNAAQTSTHLQQLQKELQETKLGAGLLRVEGPGVEIILNDRKRDSFLVDYPNMINYFIVHDSDMLHVINELRGAGAEAIAVNGTRIMANSRISCGGPTINVGKYERFAPPFIIQAIGDPEKLMEGLRMEDSIYHDLLAWGLEFQIRRLDRIEIPRYLGDTNYEYARLLQEDE